MHRHFYRWAVAGAFLIVFAGFARSYYLKELFGTRALPLLLHGHGTLMTSWFVLFFVQACLVGWRRVDLHRKLGWFGAALALVILVIGGVVVARDAARQAHDAYGSLFFLLLVAFDGLNLLTFAFLVGGAIILRRRSDFHKRLMLLATLSLLAPAIGRVTLLFTPRGSELAVLLVMDALVLLCVAIDTLRHHRLHPACAWGAVLVFAATQLTYVAQTKG